MHAHGFMQEKLNEAVMVLNKNLQVRPFLRSAKRHGLTRLQEINIQNMNVELVAQMFKNYQSNVLFHLEATDSLKEPVEQ
ncbi:DASH complex subunit dad4 [Diplodia intermedia]|uniref:DASH complex subunit DAD4 n=1 Tax=Diplodia intermedia TaxID=856260 RepID=A0ABR3TMK1_9PEZI